MGTATWEPKWWRADKHGSSWERVKEALKRDWQQTKADVNAGGKELHQSAGDTVKQATGSEPIPPPGVKNWDDVESSFRYGHGARDQYGTEHAKWDDKLEGTLKSEWEGAKATTGQSWDSVRAHVRSAYERPRP